MPKFSVRVEWSGHSRGYSVYEVDADTEDNAEYRVHPDKLVEHEVVRDDTETQDVEVTLIK